MLEIDRGLKSYVVKDVCIDMDLSDDDTPRTIRLYEKTSKAIPTHLKTM